MVQSTVLGNVYGKGSLLIRRLSNVNEDMWHWRAAVRWFIPLAAAHARKKTYLFLGLCLCVLPCCTSSGISTGNPGHPQVLQEWDCCLAVVSMQFAACFKHRVWGQGWDCCCQAGRSSRNRLLMCCSLNSFDQLWSASETQLDNVAGTHILLQA